jgi:hypothetical protein
LVVTLGRRGSGYEGAAELRDAAGAVTWAMVFPDPSHTPATTCASLIPAFAFGVSLEVDPVETPPVTPSSPPIDVLERARAALGRAAIASNDHVRDLEIAAALAVLADHKRRFPSGL